MLSNRKEERRCGKIQLIDATSLKSSLRKNLGKKNCEMTEDIPRRIAGLFLAFEENEYSKIFDNSAFGYKSPCFAPLWVMTESPSATRKAKSCRTRTPTLNKIPLDYPGGIEAFINAEVLLYAPAAWVDKKKTQIGYEISFTKHFYKPVQLRDLNEIVADIRALEAETDGLLDEVLGV